MRKRMLPEDRKAEILSAAVSLAQVSGYRALTREQVAAAAGVSPGAITFYFYHMDLLRSEVVTEAVRQGLSAIVAEGIVSGEPAALNAPEPVRFKAALSLVGGGR